MLLPEDRKGSWGCTWLILGVVVGSLVLVVLMLMLMVGFGGGLKSI